MGSVRTNECDEGIRRGRLAKADQFASAARTIVELATEESDVADAYVTLCVHAGIAASDVICCARLGRYSRGENHHEAIALLGRADAGARKHLRVLLDLKTRSGYSHTPTPLENVRQAGRAMESLLGTAHTLGS